MNFKVVLKFQSIIILTIAASMIFPLFWALLDQSADSDAFLVSIAVGMAASVLLFIAGRKTGPKDFGTREAIACAAFAWVAASLQGCLPYVIGGYMPTFTDAFFEAMSGFTTTGATVARDIEALPRGVLMWRAETQWLGGMGIVVLVIAMLPLFGVNLTRLFRAEAPGGAALQKSTPRITETALMLWRVYMGLTLLCAALLYAGGMTFYDAVAHSFAAVSTGGASPRGASVAFYNSAYIDWVLTFVMFYSGANFNLHLAALKNKSLKPYDDAEFYFYSTAVALCAVIIGAALLVSGECPDFMTAFRHASFQVVSSVTTTGFVSTNYVAWPAFAQLLMLALMLLGGCAGSTAGAIKCVRFQVLLKGVAAELKKAVHPNAVVAITRGRRFADASMATSAGCFIALYFIIWGASAVVVSLSGHGAAAAIASVGAALGNIGPGLDSTGAAAAFADHSVIAKWVYVFDMLCGRLEIYTVLVLFTKDLWRK